MPKSIAIDIHQSYPCPVCSGKLQPIFLTEALGCDRCHFVGVVSLDNCNIIQAGAFDRSWYWSGKSWHPTKSFKPMLTQGNLTIFRVTLILGIVILLCFLFKVPEIILGIASMVFLSLLLIFLPRNH